MIEAETRPDSGSRIGFRRLNVFFPLFGSRMRFVDCFVAFSTAPWLLGFRHPGFLQLLPLKILGARSMISIAMSWGVRLNPSHT